MTRPECGGDITHLGYDITEKLFGKDGVFATDLIARTENLGSQEVWLARGSTLPRPWPKPEIIEIEAGFKFEASTNWKLSSCEVFHAQPQLHCMAFRIDAGEKSFVYSGDAVKAHPDKQLSETDPDSRLMKQSTVGSLVGYNVQTAVDTEHKLIIAHEVTNSPVDRSQLLPLARLARSALARDELTVLADRGYYKGTDIKACVDEQMTTLVPRSLTSNNGARGYFPRSAFEYDPEADEYRCPANQKLTRRHSSIEKGMTIDTYYVSNPICRACELKSKCTTGINRRMRRWEHEGVLEEMQAVMDKIPEAMTLRAQTVEHPFGTLKFWMGARHFLMKRLDNVKTEMSLHVLAYNLRRMMTIVGVPALVELVR